MKALLSLTGLLAYSLTAFAAPGQVKVGWDSNVETNCTGYLILYGTRSQRYSVTNVVDGRLNNTALLTNLPIGVVYVVAQATGDDGEVSGFSNEVLWTNAPPPLTPPRNIQLHAVIQASATTNGPWSDMAWVKTSGSATNVFRAVLFREDLR